MCDYEKCDEEIISEGFCEKHKDTFKAKQKRNNCNYRIITFRQNCYISENGKIFGKIKDKKIFPIKERDRNFLQLYKFMIEMCDN